MSRLLLSVFAIGFFASSITYAFPLPKPGVSRTTLPTTFTTDHDFEGIVALSNCSGSLIRFENAKDTDHALILTNGHCLESGFPDPGQIVFGQQSDRSFRLYDATNNTVGTLNASEVVYSTMTKTDMTIYKVQETYADIKSNFNVNAFTLSSQHPNVGDQIEVVSGYWDRGYDCSIEAFVTQLKEDQWTSEDSIRYSRPGCEVVGGTSGSPVIRAGTRTVIGVNNTGNEDGEKCTMNNPCEVDKSGNITFQKGYSYGQETYWIYSCLNQYNEIDLSVKGCMLPH